MGSLVNYYPIKVEGAVSDLEALWLYEKAIEMDSVVEIGSFKGKSTHALLSGCKGLVYAIDHFQGSQDQSDGAYGRSGEDDFMKSCGHFPNLRLMKESSKKAAEGFEGKVDMVWIDGGYLTEEVIEDVTYWLPKVKKLLCGHDGFLESVKRALATCQLRYDIRVGTIWEVAIESIG